jgi:hypothetical protein
LTLFAAPWSPPLGTPLSSRIPAFTTNCPKWSASGPLYHTRLLHECSMPTAPPPPVLKSRAMRTEVRLRNQLPTPAASGGSGGVPFYTLLHCVTSDISHLQGFGCSARLCL